LKIKILEDTLQRSCCFCIYIFISQTTEYSLQEYWPLCSADKL